jgi:hypothetical protein
LGNEVAIPNRRPFFHSKFKVAQFPYPNSNLSTPLQSYMSPHSHLMIKSDGERNSERSRSADPVGSYSLYPDHNKTNSSLKIDSVNLSDIGGSFSYFPNTIRNSCVEKLRNIYKNLGETNLQFNSRVDKAFFNSPLSSAVTFLKGRRNEYHDLAIPSFSSSFSERVNNTAGALVNLNTPQVTRRRNLAFEITNLKEKIVKKNPISLSTKKKSHPKSAIVHTKTKNINNENDNQLAQYYNSFLRDNENDCKSYKSLDSYDEGRMESLPYSSSYNKSMETIQEEKQFQLLVNRPRDHYDKSLFGKLNSSPSSPIIDKEFLSYLKNAEREQKEPIHFNGYSHYLKDKKFKSQLALDQLLEEDYNY